VLGVDVEGTVRLGSHHNKFGDLLLLLRVLNDVPATAADQETLIASQPVQKIQNRKFSCGLGIVTWRQQRAIRNWTRHVLAVDGAAFHAARCERRNCTQEK